MFAKAFAGAYAVVITIMLAVGARAQSGPAINLGGAVLTLPPVPASAGECTVSAGALQVQVSVAYVSARRGLAAQNPVVYNPIHEKNRYTQCVLTVIAACLVWLCIQGYVKPQPVRADDGDVNCVITGIRIPEGRDFDVNLPVEVKNNEAIRVQVEKGPQ